MVDYDAGAGLGLYLGGFFTQIGGQSAEHIARWDGSAYQPLGSGLAGFTGGGSASGPSLQDLTVWNDGNSDLLVAGGFFTSAGGVGAPNVATWDGVSWSSLGPGLPNGVFDLEDVDRGGVPTLFAWVESILPSTLFTFERTIYRYDAQLDTWISELVLRFGSAEMGIWNDGSEERIVARGTDLASNTRGVWAVGASGVSFLAAVNQGFVGDFQTVDFGQGPLLMLGGVGLNVPGVGGAHPSLLFDGATWAMTPGVAAVTGGGVQSGIEEMGLIETDDGPRVLALGRSLFIQGEPNPARTVLFDGQAWTGGPDALIDSDFFADFFDLAVRPGTPWSTVVVAGAQVALHPENPTQGGLSVLAIATSSPGVSYGMGCPTTLGVVPSLQSEGCAVPGGQVDLNLAGLPAGTPAVLALAGQPGSLPLGGGCHLLVNSATVNLSFAASGAWQLPVPDPLALTSAFAQGFGIEIVAGIGVLSSSTGVEIVLSTALGTGF